MESQPNTNGSEWSLNSDKFKVVLHALTDVDINSIDGRDMVYRENKETAIISSDGVQLVAITDKVDGHETQQTVRFQFRVPKEYIDSIGIGDCEPWYIEEAYEHGEQLYESFVDELVACGWIDDDDILYFSPLDSECDATSITFGTRIQVPFDVIYPDLVAKTSVSVDVQTQTVFSDPSTDLFETHTKIDRYTNTDLSPDITFTVDDIGSENGDSGFDSVDGYCISNVPFGNIDYDGPSGTYVFDRNDVPQLKIGEDTPVNRAVARLLLEHADTNG